MTTTDVQSAIHLVRERSLAAVVVGASAGGLDALTLLLSRLRPPVAFPIACVIHLPSDGESLLPELLNARCPLPVKEAESTEPLAPGHIYVAPPDYHLSVEPDASFALSADPPVLLSRPSIDVLFESAAATYRDRLLGVVMTGANEDGANGLTRIHRYGGMTAVEDPATAQYDAMPEAALARLWPDIVLALPELASMLGALGGVDRSQPAPDDA